MAKSLIIVESPAKTKTLKNFLGSEFEIEASMGHVRDLPKSVLGVSIEEGFKPSYSNIPERRKVITKLREAVKSADTVYLASDPDREGEAIAWHLVQALKIPNPRRIQFNEITRTAVQNALRSPRNLDMALVNAQQARRILDRLVGYKLSPLLWSKVKKGTSAGRVQSVAVRLICERERAVRAFTPAEYWTIAADLTPKTEQSPFEAVLQKYADKKIEIKNQRQADEIVGELKKADFRVATYKESSRKRNPPPPFITSTLQQEAARALGFSNKMTMSVAQELYEGVPLEKEGEVGLITYMRTDSTRVAAEAQEQAKRYITERFGPDYLPPTPRQYKSRKDAQDAHEAIRPTSVERTPESLASSLKPAQLKLYRLIWQRFLASQMEAAVYDVATVEIVAGKYRFRATGSRVRFQGYLRVYEETKESAETDDTERPPLPILTPGQELDLIALRPEQHFTEPPPRYNQATLVKALEELGIGRPSTYATIISTIQDRGYVELVERKFVPTELGFTVTDLLVKHFPDILAVEFTAGMENQLDEVEEGKEDWVALLRDFYGPFEASLRDAKDKVEVVKPKPVETDEICPKCGRKMMLREGRYGKFLGCSGFPECKHVVPINEGLNIKCPKCGGEIVQKHSRKGMVFYGCSNYPSCDFTTWLRLIGRSCPLCGYPLGEQSFRGHTTGKVKCSNPECDYSEAAPRKGNIELGPPEEVGAGS